MQLVVQYSDACNASCAQCELNVSAWFARSRIPMDEMKRIIDTAAAAGVQALSITGGEPMLHFKEVIELLGHADLAGIRYTRTGTNGFMFMNPEGRSWERRIRNISESLASTGLYTFWISIDSCEPELHERMRGLPGVIRGIEKALPIFQEQGIYPAANLGINRNTGGEWERIALDWKNRSQVRSLHQIFLEAFSSFYRFIIGLGFTLTNACYPMSVQSAGEERLSPSYGASSANGLVRFTDQEKVQVFRALYQVIPEFRKKIRIFTPLCSLSSLIRRYRDGQETGYPCRGGVDYFFIDARHGSLFPCGFRGEENLGKTFGPGSFNHDQKPHCRLCDWECFRDPSELLGPITDGFSNPLRLIRRIRRDPGWFRLWKTDLAYARACSWFSGRSAPDYRKLAGGFEDKAAAALQTSSSLACSNIGWT